MEQYPPPPQQQQQQYYPPPPDYSNYQQQQQQQGYQANATEGYANNENNAEYGDADKIRPPSGWKDVWATALWICNLLAFIALSVIALRTYQTKSGSFGGTPSNTQYSGITFDTSTFQIFGLSAVVGFALSFMYLLLANWFPRPMIIGTFICSIIVYFGVTIFYFTQRYYSAAIVFLVFSVLYLFCFWWWKSRIPFATVMLETITSITRQYPSTIVIGVISLILQTAFNIWFMFTVVGIYEAYYSTSQNNARLNVSMVFLVFSFYWTSQVIAYTAHVIVSGIFASVYFLGDRVKSPVMGSTKRALTTSFGSICFGSLLIALVNLVRYFIDIARANTNNAILGFFLCIIDCLVGCFQGLFQWFTHYAFSGVAIYGKAFIPAAKDTWRMIKDRGIDALINDNLIGNVLFMGGLMVGVLSSLLGFIYLEVSQPAYNQDGSMTAVVVMVCFLIGASMFSSIATVISSGVATTFVCLAEDPDALRRTKPELFEKIRETWPRVVQGI